VHRVYCCKKENEGRKMGKRPRVRGRWRGERKEGQGGEVVVVVVAAPPPPFYL